MSIRETEEYKNMNPYDACSIVEGLSSFKPTYEQSVAAWQYIYDQNLYLQLQGWYGRNVYSLLESGVIEA